MTDSESSEPGDVGNTVVEAQRSFEKLLSLSANLDSKTRLALLCRHTEPHPHEQLRSQSKEVSTICRLGILYYNLFTQLTPLRTTCLWNSNLELPTEILFICLLLKVCYSKTSLSGHSV